VSCSAPTRPGARRGGGGKVNAGDNVRAVEYRLCSPWVCHCIEHVAYGVALRLLNFCCWFLCCVLSYEQEALVLHLTIISNEMHPMD
jgi:hypothetical protein